MPKFSIQKMQEIRKSKGLTYEEISKLTGLSKSTVAKVLGGFQDNPTVCFLEKMAEAFDCGVDDFFIYDKIPASPYYHDRITAETINKIHFNDTYRNLFEILFKLSQDDIDAIVNLIKRIP